MPLFVAAVFLSAFLLFQVQPVIARYILPWYGGSPGVWTTCLLFFQVGLLGGYAYAHALVSVLRDRPRLQAGIHLGLLGLALLLLPITPSPDWKPDGTEASQVAGIVRLLALSVGAPYLLLSASGPLLQHWFSEVHPGRSPYRLYAVSNLGSLLGLLTYPFLVEPRLDLKQQTWSWSLVFVLYAVFAGVAGWRFAKASRPDAGASSASAAGSRPPILDVLLWIAFSACGSLLLLSLTNQMCLDVAVVPFLWVVPLSLYLLTFVIAFDHARWYVRWIAIPMAAVAVGLTIWLMNRQFASTEWPLLRQVAIYSGAVFFGCLVCHGEVVRMKPPVRHLTGFYLAIALGGALGGLFVNLAAPRLFSGHWELHLAFAMLAILATIQMARALRRSRHPLRLAPLALPWIAALVTMDFYLLRHLEESRGSAVEARRGFYGVLQVREETDTDGELYRTLYHGRISHGRQYPDESARRLATTYYGTRSGVGVAFSCLSAREETPTREIHVGAIGLGVGTIATYADPGDRFRFYEINPQVEELAREHFTYLADSGGEVEVVLGDARISLERELAESGPQEFDLLFVDAFSGDSIPIHLVTREAFELYFRHLKPDGVLAVHVTNLHIDLSDPVRTLAEHFGKKAFRIEHIPDYEPHAYYSDWILITTDGEFIGNLDVSERVVPWEREEARSILWTDDYCNLFEVLM